MTQTNFPFSGRWIHVARSLRPRHWVKNLLVIVAPLGAGVLSAPSIPLLLLSFISLSAAASGTYLLNDVKDREQDALHPLKKSRAVASGLLKPVPAVFLAMGLVAISVIVMSFVNALALAAVVGYSLISISYSLKFKRVPALDIVILAGLFVLRIFVGALAVEVEVSTWLLATSFFIFLSLASAKRFIELSLPDFGGGNNLLHGRGYLPSDRPIMQIGGYSAGFISAMLLGQYVESGHRGSGVGLPELLWLVVPLWVYWISRFWILVSRGRVEHDPVEFVLRDGVSYMVGALILGVYFISRGTL